MKAHVDNGHMRCIGCQGANDEGFWFVLPDSGDREKVECPRCFERFCGKCRRTPYHYGCNCEDVMTLSNEWMRWLNEGRQTYMQQLARAGREYEQLLNQYAQRKAQFERDKVEAEARHRELIQNEEWKQARCKRCPSCRRVVEKVL